MNLPGQPSEQFTIHRIVLAINSEQMIARWSSSNCDCPRRRRCGSSARFWLSNFVGASSVNDASFCVERWHSEGCTIWRASSIVANRISCFFVLLHRVVSSWDPLDSLMDWVPSKSLCPRWTIQAWQKAMTRFARVIEYKTSHLEDVNHFDVTL